MTRHQQSNALLPRRHVVNHVEINHIPPTHPLDSHEMSTLDPDGEDPSQKANRLAARAARFNKSAPGKRNKEVSPLLLITDIS